MTTSNRVLIGELTAGISITLFGFLRKRRKLKNITFFTIQDWTGDIQAVAKNQNKEIIDALNIESCISVTGTVTKGETKDGCERLEINVEDINILNKCTQECLPFELTGAIDSKENTRLKYRYLDIRNSIYKNLITRSKIVSFLRNHLEKSGFIEIATPTLSGPSSEGSDLFRVTSDVEGDRSFYLAQSPQLYKQLLMNGGIEKYFQLATSYRNEDLRADRQLEFTQLDLEVCFKSSCEIRLFLEQMLKEMIVSVFGSEIEVNFQTMTYNEAIEKYGTDSPDITSPMEVEEYEGRERVVLETNQLNELGEGSIPPFCKVNRDDQVLIAPEDFRAINLFKREVTNALKLRKRGFTFLWLIDWPLFFKNDDGTMVSSHHPFTNSTTGMVELDSRSTGYDLILDGIELGSGSDRIFQADQLRKSLGLVSLDKQVPSSLEWFVNSFQFGTPPHSGFAIGIERLIAGLLRSPTIRDVIAFPLNGKGVCCMSESN